MPTRRKARPEEGDALSTYRAKRAFDQTPEPGGLVPKPASKPGGLLIVHMHDATRLHWDLRLEMDGVLRSWAVPKGPSANPADKRLAVKVEDHPLEYGDFEGIIPEGNYGAGTVVVWDRGIWEPLEDPEEGLEKGKLLFNMLQMRAKLGASEAKRAAIESPATLYVFDLLAFGGYDLRKLPLVARKAILQKVLPQTGPLRYSDHFEKNGEALYEQVVRLGLEGIMAKKADSPYRSGRSADWLKIRADRMDDFVVVGFTKPKGARGGFGSLHVGAYQGGKLIYCGRAGSGFTGDQLDEISAKLQALVRPTPPCEPPPGGALPKGPDHTWVEPKLVCDVRYKEMTKDGLLRQSVFVRFRDDKQPEDVVMPGNEQRETGNDREPQEAPTSPVSRAPVREVKFSNLGKIFWPEEKYTKGDLIEYYRSMAPWLLPYLKNRPVVLTRYPDGITGKSFYQKDAP